MNRNSRLFNKAHSRTSLVENLDQIGSPDVVEQAMTKWTGRRCLKSSEQFRIQPVFFA